MDAPPYVIQVDALYFQARESGVHYAIKNDEVIYPDFKSHFGARAKLGVPLCYDGWQLWLQFLHFHARTRSHVSGKIIPTWGHPLTVSEGFVDDAFSLWRLHLGFGDVAIAKCWSVSSCVDLWPFLGVRFASIRRKAHIDYLGGTVFPGSEEFSMKNKYWGVGPQVGMELIWHVASWASVFARGAYTLLSGEFYIHQDQDDALGTLKFFNEFHQIRPIIEMALGFQLEWRCLYGRVAGELYFMEGQNQLARFTSSEMEAKFVANQGDLSLHGLSFGIGVKF